MTNRGGYGIRTALEAADGEKCGSNDSCSEMETEETKETEVESQKCRAITWSFRSDVYGGIDDKLVAMGRRLGDLAVRGEVRMAVFPKCQRW